MKCIVGLSGTHGTGKSTILQGVKALGYPVSESQLSRTAQKALGWDTLKRAQESFENMWLLQDAVLIAMDERDKQIATSGKVTLTERSPADLWAYTVMWCERLKISMDYPRVKSYYDSCRDLARRYAAILIVPAVDAIPFVEEPNRADLASRVPVANSINEFLSTENSYRIEQTAPDERVLEVQLLLENLKDQRYNNGILI